MYSCFETPILNIYEMSVTTLIAKNGGMMGRLSGILLGQRREDSLSHYLC